MKLYRPFSFFLGCACGKEVVQLNGKCYLVKQRLADGGFSVVDLVQDRDTYRVYALKRIPCHSKQDERLAMQEAEYYNAFNHPNIVPIVDVALAEKVDDYYISRSEVRILLPYYKKGTLQDELVMRRKHQQPMSEERVLGLFVQMCEGIRAMHNAQPHPLAHRDIKPSNVLLADDETPVWMDFGSMGKARMEIYKCSEAQALQDLAAEKCTMSYRAPELFHVESHSSVDERVDIWSLGCCLYAMCYFRSPFEETQERGDSIALAVLRGSVEFPREDIYSSGLKDLIRSMLEVNLLQRPFIDGVLLQLDALASNIADVL